MSTVDPQRSFTELRKSLNKVKRAAIGDLKDVVRRIWCAREPGSDRTIYAKPVRSAVAASRYFALAFQEPRRQFGVSGVLHPA
jgi:hypothetical protein